MVEGAAVLPEFLSEDEEEEEGASTSASASGALLTLSLNGLPLMCWSYRRRANEKSPSFGTMYTNS